MLDMLLVGFVSVVLVRDTGNQSQADTEMACGPSSLSMSSRLLDRSVSADVLSRALGRLDRLYTMLELKQGAETLGFSTLALRTDADYVAVARLPTIVALRDVRIGGEHAHFVVLYGEADGKIQVLDYPRPPRFVSRSDLSKIWDGKALHIAANGSDLKGIAAQASTTAVWLRYIGWLLVLASAMTSMVLVRVLLRRRFFHSPDFIGTQTRASSQN